MFIGLAINYVSEDLQMNELTAGPLIFYLPLNNLEPKKSLEKTGYHVSLVIKSNPKRVPETSVTFKPIM